MQLAVDVELINKSTLGHKLKVNDAIKPNLSIQTQKQLVTELIKSKYETTYHL